MKVADKSDICNKGDGRHRRFNKSDYLALLNDGYEKMDSGHSNTVCLLLIAHRAARLHA